MPRGIPRVQNVEVPGAVEADAPEAEGLPPDVQALVDAAVANALKQQRRAQLLGAVTSDLPSQEEALAQVNSDTKRRSVLSKDGWVVTNSPVVKGRDPDGFAKD